MSQASPSRTLEFDFSRGSDTSRVSTVAVLLHGRGSDKHDLQGLRSSLPAEWSIVTPRAPFPGAPWGYGQGFAWYRYLEEDRVVEETMGESLDLLEGFLGGLSTSIGFEPGRILLGGFSQGGTMSMAFAITRPGKIAAVLNFSGFLASWLGVDETGAAPPATPIFWGTGTGDPSIPFALAERGRARLRRAGANLVTRDYRMGHWIDAAEVADAVEMVRGLEGPS